MHDLGCARQNRREIPPAFARPTAGKLSATLLGMTTWGGGNGARCGQSGVEPPHSIGARQASSAPTWEREQS